MKLRFFLIPALLTVIVAIAVISCSKSNNGSKPTISIKSINSPIDSTGGMEAVISFNSPSGKLGQGTFLAIRKRLNKRPPNLPSASQNDTFTKPLNIPDFPDNKGEFHYTMQWIYLHESDFENDTLVFKFAAIDRNGHSSDTITSPKIVIIK